MSKQCGCRLCRQSLDFITLRNALPEELIPLLENIENDLCYTKDELYYLQRITENKWPSAEEHMKALGWKRIED